MVKKGIKIINVDSIKKQDKDKTYKFIRNALEDKKMGSIVIEVDDYNDKELICNISERSGRDHKDLEEEMDPLLKAKKINIFELWHFDYDMFYVKEKDRIVVSEKRQRDINEFKEYCQKHKIDIDDLLYTILTCESCEK